MRWKRYKKSSTCFDLCGFVQVMQCIYDMFEGLGKRPSGDPKERAGMIFRKIDINGDGDLTENEFIKGCSEDKVKDEI